MADRNRPSTPENVPQENAPRTSDHAEILAELLLESRPLHEAALDGYWLNYPGDDELA